MDKYDYITTTILEEKTRLENIISYLEKNDTNDDILEYKERYNNICNYLISKEKYQNIIKKIDDYKEKLEKLKELKTEYEVDNILLEDTLLTKFNTDTNNEYQNILYEDIKNKDNNIKDILYLILEKESDYSELITKRNKLFKVIDKYRFPNTYDTLVSQSILLEKQSNILDDIYVTENNIQIEQDNLDTIINSVMTPEILKILYEFLIIDDYDINKIDKSKIFDDNKLIIENNQTEEKLIEEIEENDKVIPDLNLPGFNENNLIEIDGKEYLNN